jgi:molybdate transport system ATP-binding protein
MNDGKILASGPTKDLFEDPQTVAAARLTGCKNISRVQCLGDHRVLALDWNNLELTTACKVTPGVSHIGIRAHDFEPTDTEAGAFENYIPIHCADISEMPFEWYITLDNGLWWKTEKTIHTHSAAGIVPKGLRVDPTAILLLHE